MFFHTKLEGPESSSRGTSSAKGPNSTWSVTINPTSLTQTPHPNRPHNILTLNTILGKASNSQPAVRSFPLGRRLLETSDEDVGPPLAVNISNRSLSFFTAADMPEKERKLTVGHSQSTYKCLGKKLNAQCLRKRLMRFTVYLPC